MKKRYKVSKENIVQNFVSKIKIKGIDYYLLEDENGETLQELGEPYYEMLLMLMDYNSLVTTKK